MRNTIKSFLLLFTMFVPIVAYAKPAPRAALEARVGALEAELKEMRELLKAAQAQNSSVAVSVATTQSSVTSVDTQVQNLASMEQVRNSKIEALEKKVTATPADGFKVGNATIKIGGFIKAETILTRFNGGDVQGLARDFYVPGATPVGAAAVREGAHFDGHIKQTRLALTIAAPVGDHKLGGYVETDFQSSPGAGDERLTNAYNLALRRGYLTFDNWLFGQDWTTFMNVGALPETTDFIGPTDGVIFSRQAMIRYSHKLSDIATLVVAAENPETSAFSGGALTIFDDDKLPDMVARLNLKSSFGEFSLSGIARQLSVRTGATYNQSVLGWGISAAGKIPFGPKGRNDIRFMLNGGEGVGRYLALNFAPDAVIVNTPGSQDLKPVGMISGFVAARYYWSDDLRSTVSFSIMDVRNPAGVSALTANKQSWSVFGNLFYSPAKGFDIGFEYRHANRELLNGVDGSMDRLHFIAKQSF